MNRKLFSWLLIFCFLFGIVLEFTPTTKATVPWADSNFAFRKSHLINQLAGADVNYQVNFTIHYGLGTDSNYDVYLNSLCRTDFQDIRIYDINGSLLSAWNQTQTNSDNIKVWAKLVANLTASSDTIYLYYGNSTTTAYWDKTSTFVDVISGVVGAWQLEEGTSATAADSSGNNNNGTATGTSIVSSPFFTGKNARTPSGGYVTITNASPLNPTVQITLYQWIKLSSYPTSGNYMSPLYKGGNNQWYFQITNDTKITVYFKLAGHNSWDYSPSAVLPLNTATLVIFTYDTVHTTLYFNSTQKQQLNAANASIGTDGGNLVLGDADTHSKNVNGIIGETGILNVALNITQITNIASNYPDPTLLAGSILIRKYVGSDGPTQSVWGTPEQYIAPTPTAAPTPSPTPIAAPYANFFFSPSNPIINQTVTFTSTSTNTTDITVWKWNFGDGNTTTGAYPQITHSYLTNQTFSVTLNVTSSGGSNTLTLPLTVGAVAVVDDSALAIGIVALTFAVCIPFVVVMMYRKKQED